MPSEHKIGALAAISYTIGNMVGSGIFISPTSILKESGSVGSSLLVWGVCGAISLLGSLCYIELATSVHQSGADLAYVTYVGWPPIAFSFVWINFIALPCGAAIVAEAFGEYCVEIARVFACIDEHAESTAWAVHLAGFCLVFVLTYLNLHSLKHIMAPFQVVATACKLLSMAAIILIGFYYLFFQGWTESYQGALVGTKWSPGHLVLAIYAGLWAFSGWEVLNFGTEEIKNPKWTFPLASFGGTLFVTVIYLAINIAYFTVLNREEMLESDTVAATFSNRVMRPAPFVVPILIAVNLIGTLNTNIFMSTRLHILVCSHLGWYYFAAARSGLLPITSLGLLSPDSGSPRPAVLLYGVSTLVAMFVGDLSDLINIYTFCISFQRVFTMAALMKIRLDNIPVDADAVQFPLVMHMFFGALSVLLVIIPLYQMFRLCAIGIAVVLCSFSAYFVLERFKYRLIRFTQANHALALICQKLLIVVPDEPIYNRFHRRLSITGHGRVKRRRH